MFVIPSGLITLYQERADALLEFGNLRHTHRVVYTPRQEQCPNCIINTFNGISTSIYNGTGPQPFTFGSCPVCGGNGYIEREYSETVKINILWNPRQWVGTVPHFDTAGDRIQVRGYLADLPKLSKCDHLLIDAALTHYDSYRFVREGQMVPFGLGEPKYCMGFWKRQL